MDKTFSEIKNEAMALPDNERAILARGLIESLDDDSPEECEQEWLAEIDRRCAEIDSGKAQLIDSETVIRELRSKYLQ